LRPVRFSLQPLQQNTEIFHYRGLRKKRTSPPIDPFRVSKYQKAQGKTSILQMFLHKKNKLSEKDTTFEQIRLFRVFLIGKVKRLAPRLKSLLICEPEVPLEGEEQ
jgi:hypothetical protein